MSEKYRHYIAEGGILHGLERLDEQLAERNEKLDAIVAEIGADRVVTRGPRIVGFTFKGNPPDGFVEQGAISGTPYFGPQRRKKADKDFWARVGEANFDVGAHLNKLLLGDTWGVVTSEIPSRGYGNIVRSCTLEELDGKRVIGIPIPGRDDVKETVPPGCTPLKLSEYYAMKEREEEAQ